MAGYVSLQDVTKTYKMGEVTIKAADGISFDVEKGEFVILTPPRRRLPLCLPIAGEAPIY